jgi:hypothetical protein
MLSVEKKFWEWQMDQFTKAVKQWAYNTVAGGVGLMIAAPCLLAVGLLFLQCLGWLKQAVWQPLPFGLLFLSPEGQLDQVLMYFPMHPIRYVPSLGSSANFQEIAYRFAGNFEGEKLVIEWFLGTPLLLWLVALPMGVVALVQAAENGARSGQNR